MLKQEMNNGLEEQNINRFWISFYAWINSNEIVKSMIRDEFVYVGEGYMGDFWYRINVDYEEEYRIKYGINIPANLREENSMVSFNEVKDYIELMFERLVKTDKRYDFTIFVNKKFAECHLPYRLSSGKIISKRYKTTESVEKILNRRMFESKIAYSEEMIMSNDILYKKSALDFIIDALQYYISIQNEKDVNKKYANASKSVCEDQNSKVYAVVKKEIEEIMKISNEFFDIRHNEYLNDAKEKREALKDLQFIEYLYNRAYGLLYLLRLKSKNANLIETDYK